MYERLCVCSTKLLADHISSGNAILNSGENILIVDNLVNGFDIYKYPHTAPFNAIEVPRENTFHTWGQFHRKRITSSMRQRSWHSLLVFCGKRRETAEIEAWVSNNHDPSIRCELFFPFFQIW